MHHGSCIMHTCMYQDSGSCIIYQGQGSESYNMHTGRPEGPTRSQARWGPLTSIINNQCQIFKSALRTNFESFQDNLVGKPFSRRPALHRERPDWEWNWAWDCLPGRAVSSGWNQNGDNDSEKSDGNRHSHCRCHHHPSWLSCLFTRACRRMQLRSPHAGQWSLHNVLFVKYDSPVSEIAPCFQCKFCSSYRAILYYMGYI